MILINGANCLQAFFSITGFLLALQFMDLREKNKYNTAYFWKAVSYRYLRWVDRFLALCITNYYNIFSCGKLKYCISHVFHTFVFSSYRFTPTYLFIVLFNATMFFKLGSGPVWPLLAEHERTSCRNNWWTNVLYVNNFINTKEPVSWQN